MTAKPQPMAGNPDASDDLIAQLAKLMAQDANSERPVEPLRPVLPVRIPGAANAPASPAAPNPVPAPPAPRFDFERSSAAAARAPAPSSPIAARPVAEPVVESSEPFRFDFELVAPKNAPVTAVPQREAVARPDVALPSAPVPTPDPTFAPVDHDSIADLIAAELLGMAEPARSDDVARDEAPPQREPQPVAAQAARPAPQPGPGWAPAPVAANLDQAARPSKPAMRPLNLQAAPRGEQDRFKVAPVFGLGSGTTEPFVAPVVNVSVAPAPISADATIAGPLTAAPGRTEPSFGWRQPAPAPTDEPEPQIDDDGLGRDPIDEIESLIGNAMRAELGRSSAAPVESARMSSSPTPALRSLATPVAPATPALSPGQRKLSGADEAVLAAAEATGVQIGWVDTPEVADAEPAAPRRERRARMPGMTRALAGPLVAVTLLLAAGFGLYWVLGLGSESGPAPVLTADATPVKEVPAVDPDAAVPQQSVVFNEIDGVVPGAEEQLVSRDQADLNEVTAVPPTADVSEEGLANRKVRTVTVRPDGTIVSGEDSVAGSNILPVARPNVPAVPGAETASPELLASTQPAATPATTETPAAAATPTPGAATPAVTPVTPGATVPAVDLAGNPLPGKTTVVPMIRPAGLSVPGAAEVAASAPTSPVNAVVNGSSGGNMLPPPPSNNTLTGTNAAAVAAPAPVQSATPAAQAATPVTSGSTAPAYVQLASQRTEDEARATAQAMVSRYGPLFGGANLEVQRVDLGERGIYYRVRVPATSAADAGNICTNVKAAGGDCFTM